MRDGDPNMAQPHDILDFWFGPGDPDDPANARFGLWFGANADLDRDIRARFLPTIEAAALGHLEHWKESPEGRLAWTLLLDQFTRNAYRNSYRMFAFDMLALQSTREAVAQGQDRALPALHRGFLYLPLEHSEEAAAQDESVALYRALATEAPAAMHGIIGSMLDYAERHAVVIRRFGRYPHRNALLGRQTTVEEAAFLASAAAPF
jgi:uncharacterized protein (DUF924 family)